MHFRIRVVIAQRPAFQFSLYGSWRHHQIEAGKLFDEEEKNATDFCKAFFLFKNCAARRLCTMRWPLRLAKPCRELTAIALLAMQSLFLTRKLFLCLLLFLDWLHGSRIFGLIIIIWYKSNDFLSYFLAGISYAYVFLRRREKIQFFFNHGN